jgi:hypothetical protein
MTAIQRDMNMDKCMPESDTSIPRLKIFEACMENSCNGITFDLQKYRNRILELKEAEQFWAGRRLAQRNSTRRAA